MPCEETPLTLWGTTMVDLREVMIFLDPGLEGAWGTTYQDSKKPNAKGFIPYIHLHPDVLDRPGEVLDEILCHEFIHVLEYMFPQELRAKPINCSAAATVFGRHLPRMLKYLRRASLKL